MSGKKWAKAAADQLRHATLAHISDVDVVPLLTACFDAAMDEAREELYREAALCRNQRDMITLVEEWAEYIDE